MSYSKIPDPPDPPVPEEFEISLFGRGIGEAVAVHLGYGRWLTVDSCLDPETRTPVALEYLRKMGVEPEKALRLVVITHWHNDHVQGAADILRAAPDAKVVMSAAMTHREFRRVFGVKEPSPGATAGIEELRRVMDVLRDRSEGRQVGAGPVWAIESKQLLTDDFGVGIEVHALSPADATFTESLHEIASLLPQEGRMKRRAVSHTPNTVSVVLWVRVGDRRLLLGGDLEARKDRRTGWTAIVESTTRPDGRAEVFKVAHHGADNADERGIWDELLTANPAAILAPYLGGKKPRPTAQDLERLRAATGSLFCAGPLQGRKVTDLPHEVRRLVRASSKNLREIETPLGQVRIRGDFANGPLDVCLGGSAIEIPPLAA